MSTGPGKCHLNPTTSSIPRSCNLPIHGGNRNAQRGSGSFSMPSMRLAMYSAMTGPNSNPSAVPPPATHTFENTGKRSMMKISRTRSSRNGRRASRGGAPSTRCGKSLDEEYGGWRRSCNQRRDRLCRGQSARTAQPHAEPAISGSSAAHPVTLGTSDFGMFRNVKRYVSPRHPEVVDVAGANLECTSPRFGRSLREPRSEREDECSGGRSSRARRAYILQPVAGAIAERRMPINNSPPDYRNASATT